jgi:hypothetical protein
VDGFYLMNEEKGVEDVWRLRGNLENKGLEIGIEG